MPQLMEVVLDTLYNDQQCINRWNFIANGTPAAVSMSFGLASALGAIDPSTDFVPATVMSDIQDLVSTQVEFVQLTVRDVYSATDFYQVPFLGQKQGQQGGTAMSPFNAYAMRTNRTNWLIRRGTKRFVGVVEEQISTFGTLQTAVQTLLTSIATRLNNGLTYVDEGQNLTYATVVVSKEQYVPDPLFPNRVAYKYYETYEEQADHIATGVLWERVERVTTQNSRKIGRGR